GSAGNANNTRAQSARMLQLHDAPARRCTSAVNLAALSLGGCREFRAICRARKRSFPAQLADELLEAGKLLLDEVDAGLVLELHRLLVELGVRHPDENLRLVERERIEKHAGLTQLILH